MDDSHDIYINEDDFRRRYEYKPSDLIGEGGFAQVYKAYDKQFHEYVALKFYNKGEKGKYDVLHEMKDTRTFSHKNIIRVHDAFVVRFEHAGTHSYIQVGVLEYANGGNLRDFSETGQSEDLFIKVLSGIVEGIKYLHTEKGIIHRDLSPENILMFVEGDKWIPKISDFGISKKIDYDSFGKNSKKSTQLLGKIEYMAPEQFYPEKFGIDGKINTNVDLWAFGIILYELFMHKTPFGSKTGDNPMSGIHSIINDPVVGMNEIPLPYRKVIEMCLVKKAGRRVQNPEEIISSFKKSDRQSEKNQVKTITITELNKDTKILKRVGIILAVTIVCIAGYFAVNNLSKPATTVIVNEIDSLMKVKKYSEALLLTDKLSDKKKGIPEIAALVKECRIQLSRDSITALLLDKKFSLATTYFEKLPEDFKSDSGLVLRYRQSAVSLAKDSLNSLINNKDFLAGREYFLELNDQVKRDLEIVSLYNNMISCAAIDSLIKEGNREFEYKNYIQAKIAFNSVLVKYDSKNQIAVSMIRKIDGLIKSPEPEKIIIPSSSDCLQKYSGSNLMVSESPDPREVTLISICITASKMNITIEIQSLKSQYTIYNPLSNDAFYIEFDNGKQQLKLKDVLGVVTNRKLTNPKPVRVELEFNRLPAEVKTFNIIEGKNQKDKNKQYWNFKGVRLF
jgi:serine/threonine protein kinase